MRWPFVLRRVYEVELAAKDRELAEARQHASYWRARAELFLDRAAARAGISHEPIMTGPSDIPIDPFAVNPFGGLALTEFDSTKTDGKARN